MTSRFFRAYFLAVLVCLGASALGDTAAQPRLTLAQAVSTALGTNANLKQAEEQRLSSLSALRIAGFTTSYGIGSTANLESVPGNAGPAGKLYGSFSLNTPKGTEASLDIAPFGLGDQNGSIALSIRHPLMQGKGRLSSKGNSLLSAESDARVQDKQLYITRQSTVVGVVSAYCKALLDREQIKVQEQAVGIAEEVAQRAQKLTDAGKVAEIEVTRAEIRVAQTKDQLNLQRQSARTSMDRLMVAIGSGVGETPELADAVPSPKIDVPPLGDAVKVAFANRVELSVLDEQLESQHRRSGMALDALRPRLDAVAGFNSTTNDRTIISRSLFDVGSLIAGLELRFPLDTRITQEERGSAERNINLIHELRDYQIENISEEVRSAYRDWESAQTSLDILGQNLKVAEDNLRLAQRMVEEGLDDNRNVLEAQQELTRVQSDLLSAKVNLFLAKVNLRHAMGDDLTVLEWE